MTEFAVGDRIVYPHHGAAVITSRKVRVLMDKRREYLSLEFIHGNLEMMVPVESIDDVGLRPVISRDEVDGVLTLLRQRGVRLPTNWSRRYKNHVDKLKSGDIYQVSEVMRNLTHRSEVKTLSAGERKLLDKAALILTSELSFALDQPEAEVSTMLDGILAEGKEE